MFKLFCKDNRYKPVNDDFYYLEMRLFGHFDVKMITLYL